MKFASLTLARYVIATFKSGTTYQTPITSRTLTHELIDGIALNISRNGHADEIEGYDVRDVKTVILAHERKAHVIYDSVLRSSANHYSVAYRAYCTAIESEIVS